jgi:hypothetical protein
MDDTEEQVEPLHLEFEDREVYLAKVPVRSRRASVSACCGLLRIHTWWFDYMKQPALAMAWKNVQGAIPKLTLRSITIWAWELMACGNVQKAS